MSLPAPHKFNCSRLSLAVCVTAAAAVAGCDSNHAANSTTHQAPAQVPVSTTASSASETSESRFDKNREFQKRPVARFAGRVTVDGQPPKKDAKLFLVLTDSAHLDENAHGMLPTYYTGCDAEGNFVFGTYDKADGVPAGKYVVSFMELHESRSKAPTKSRSKGPTSVGSAKGNHSFGWPDELKNLYSDPDKNVGEKQFNLDLQPPGKDDYHFDLMLAGKAPVVKAGAHAVRSLILRP